MALSYVSSCCHAPRTLPLTSTSAGMSRGTPRWSRLHSTATHVMSRKLYMISFNQWCLKKHDTTQRVGHHSRNSIGNDRRDARCDQMRRHVTCSRQAKGNGVGGAATHVSHLDTLVVVVQPRPLYPWRRTIKERNCPQGPSKYYEKHYKKQMLRLYTLGLLAVLQTHRSRR